MDANSQQEAFIFAAFFSPQSHPSLGLCVFPNSKYFHLGQIHIFQFGVIVHPIMSPAPPFHKFFHSRRVLGASNSAKKKEFSGRVTPRRRKRPLHGLPRARPFRQSEIRRGRRPLAIRAGRRLCAYLCRPPYHR